MREGTPQLAFIISLIGGLLIILGSAAMLVMMAVGFWWMGQTDDHYHMMGLYLMDSGFLLAVLIWDAICGGAVIVSSVLLVLRPLRATTWGLMTLVFSSLSLIFMGGFFIGGVLGITGGALSLVWKRGERSVW